MSLKEDNRPKDELYFFIIKKMAYNYREETAENIRQWLEENREIIDEEKKASLETLKDYLHDALRTEDSITGNGSGSYTFNTEEARKNLEGNEELVEEMVNEFCVDMGKHWNEYEYLDVSIRCYILDECIDRVLTDCTRTCDTCGKVFIEGYLINDIDYYCSDECLKESLTEGEIIEDLRLGEDDSPNYRTSRIECLS